MTTPRRNTHRTTRRVPLEHKLDKIQKSINELRSLFELYISQKGQSQGQAQVLKEQGQGQGQMDLGIPAPLGQEAPIPPSSGKKRTKFNNWNEYVSQYILDQKAKGRIIKRPQAMLEAGPIFREMNPKTRKKSKIPSIRVAPASAAVQVQSPITPGTLVSLTPGRGSPIKAANAPPALQTLLERRNNSSRPPTPLAPIPRAPTPLAPIPRAPTPQAPTSQAQAQAQVQAQAQAPQTIPTLQSLVNTFTGTRNNSRPSPATYAYEDMGLGANSPARKILIDGNKYYMTDKDRGLFQRSDNDGVGDWVGYLEPGGEIRYTEGADEE